MITDQIEGFQQTRNSFGHFSQGHFKHCSSGSILISYGHTKLNILTFALGLAPASGSQAPASPPMLEGAVGGVILPPTPPPSSVSPPRDLPPPDYDTAVGKDQIYIHTGSYVQKISLRN